MRGKPGNHLDKMVEKGEGLGLRPWDIHRCEREREFVFGAEKVGRTSRNN
jgi:hypothetical protein